MGDDRTFGGRGSPSSGELFPAAPNVDHSQSFVKEDIKEWMQWLREYIGYDGWRLTTVFFVYSLRTSGGIFRNFCLIFVGGGQGRDRLNMTQYLNMTYFN